MSLRQAISVLAIGLSLAATGIAQEGENPMVTLKTSLGDIKLELYPDKAPDTVKNFLQYVDAGFYKGTIFHRVIRNFMIQGGGFDVRMSRKQTNPPIKNEAANGLKNGRGTIAMARTQIPDSATSQFFINTVDNRSLDFKNPSSMGIGYCVFGRVTEGMDIVDKIESVATGVKSGMRDVPQSDVIIEDATRVKAEPESPAAESRE
jgi:cyclophilin family peptidyl-prolyl cis-trans isomerase